MALRGYLPPDGTQNIHQTPYRYREGQGAHQVGRSLIRSPEAVILTADEFAQREAERYDLDEVSEEVAQEALDAYQDDGDVASVLSGADSGGSGGQDGSADTTEGDDTAAPFDPADFTVSELREQLSGDESDAEREALADAERDGEDRDTAIDVLAP